MIGQMKIADILVLALGAVAFVSLMRDEPEPEWLAVQKAAVVQPVGGSLNFLSRPYDEATWDGVR